MDHFELTGSLSFLGKDEEFLYFLCRRRFHFEITNLDSDFSARSSVKPSGNARHEWWSDGAYELDGEVAQVQRKIGP